MAFTGGLGPGSGVTPPSTTTGGGGVDRTTIVSTFVVGTPTGIGQTPTTVTVKPVLPASAGIFGGTSTETASGGEARERIESKARAEERFNPPAMVRGPLVAPWMDLGRALPLGEMPARAAERFFAAAARGKV